MTYTLEIIKKYIIALIGGSFILGLLFVAGCSEDDDPEPYAIPGTYVFNKAILKTAITIGIFTVPAGHNITEQIEEAILSTAACSDAGNGALDLKTDNSLYLTCRTEGTETQAGTWSVNADTTQLTFNLPSLPISATLPSLVLFDLDINRSNDIIKGTAKGFPIDKATLSAFLNSIPGGAAFIGSIPDNFDQQVDVEIELQKVDM